MYGSAVAEPWHSKSVDDVLEELNPKRSGLTEKEAAERLEIHGPNQLETQKKPSPIKLFLKQFLSPPYLRRRCCCNHISLSLGIP